MSTSAAVSDADIAAELRALAAALHRTSVNDHARAESLGLLRSAGKLLSDGAPRLRWYETEPDVHVGPRGRNRELSTFSGSHNAVAPPMALRVGELDDETPAMIGTVELDRLREGPPGSVHGGVLAGLFDEIMGAAHRLGGGAAGVTGRLSVRYRARTPLDTPLEFRAWPHRGRGRLITVRAQCRANDTVTATAEALFVRSPA